MNVSTIALQGLQQADAQLGSAASKIASFGASSPTGANLDTVDLSAAVVALLSAKNLYSANLSTVKVADETQKTTIDLIA
jgi:flagellar hook protein FlgE